MISRGVGKKIEQHGPEYPFEPVIPILRDADLTVINLESPIAVGGEPLLRKEIRFKAIPNAVEGLISAGVDVVSLANNHSFDYGQAGFFETMDILAHSGIAYVGAGFDSVSASRPALIIRKGVRIAVLGYSWDFYLTIPAGENNAGVTVMTEEQLRSDISNVSPWADLIVVTVHWGWEYVERPTERDRKLAHLAVDLGADLVVGHHPHVIQGIERYKNGLICYSLGNFIFDQHSSKTRQGLLLCCRATREGIKKAVIVPIEIHQQEFRPYPAVGGIAEEILERTRNLSSKLDTEIIIDGNKGLILDESAKSEREAQVGLFERIQR